MSNAYYSNCLSSSSNKKWALKSMEAAYLKGDAEGVKAALEKNSLDIRYLPAVQGDRDIALLAVKVNGLARFWLDPDLLADPEIAGVAEKNLPGEFAGNARKIERGQRIYSVRLPAIEEIKELNMEDELRYVNLEWESCSSFLRDSHVTLFSGEHLIPHPIKEACFTDLLEAIVPQTADHFFSGESRQVIGYGFLEENTDQAMVMAYDHNIPFTSAKTCMEGGNCFLFIAGGGKKALVGELSLYLSWIALEEQGEFNRIEVDLNAEPSEEALRMARNLALYRGAGRSLEQNAYRKLLIDPLSEEDRIAYSEKARQIEAQLKRTKECMARELEVSVADLAFVPQTKFHIDMELFVTPSGGLVLHDDQKVLEFLEELQGIVLTEKESALADAYLATARKRIETLAGIQEKRKEILKGQGLQVELIPGVFEAPAFESALNYCNGIFVKEKEKSSLTFVTTGPSIEEENIFHSRFTALFNRLIPETTLQGISGVSTLVAKFSGGIRCLTVECSLAGQRGDSYVQ